MIGWLFFTWEPPWPLQTPKTWAVDWELKRPSINKLIGDWRKLGIVETTSSISGRLPQIDVTPYTCTLLNSNRLLGSVWLIIFFSTVNLSSKRLISSPVVVASATISVDDSSLQACKSIVEHSPVTYEEAELWARFNAAELGEWD